MIPGETPLDFLRKNLREPIKVVEPQAIVDQVSKERDAKAAAEAAAAAVTVEPKPQEPTYDITPEVKKEEPTGGAAELVVGEDGEDASESTPAAENFKRLRTALKETNKTLETIKAEKEAVEKDLEKYKTGEAFPEVLQEKENKIAQLSRYEKLVSLKTSKEYQEAFIKPLSTLETKLAEYGKEYGIPPEVMNKALNLKTTPEINRFLEEHFDGIAALEVKQVIKDMQGLQERAREAELEPAKEIEKLREQHATIEAGKRIQRQNTIVAKSKDAWGKALHTVQAEGRITPLLYKENDTEFNQRYSIPIRTKAAQEFGKLITELTNSGLEDISEEAAMALANYVLHANASAVNFEFGKAALEYADDIERNVSKVTPILRPDIGGSGVDMGGRDAGGAKTPDSPQAAARALLTKHVLAAR